MSYEVERWNSYTICVWYIDEFKRLKFVTQDLRQALYMYYDMTIKERHLVVGITMSGQKVCFDYGLSEWEEYFCTNGYNLELVRDEMFHEGDRSFWGSYANTIFLESNFTGHVDEPCNAVISGVKYGNATMRKFFKNGIHTNTYVCWHVPVTGKTGSYGDLYVFNTRYIEKMVELSKKWLNISDYDYQNNTY